MPAVPTQRRRRNPRGGGEALRADLVAAASHLLETLPGEEALSLRAVAREAGVSAPSVYLHFDDKTALVWAVLEERFAELRSALDTAAADAAGDPRAELRARCLAYCDFADAHPGQYRVMFAAASSGDVPESAELPGADIIGTIAGVLARCLGGGRRAEAPATAMLLWCGLHGIATLRRGKPALPWPPRDAMVDTLLGALLTTPLPAPGRAG